MRQYVKYTSGWPTYPQLYRAGALLGGVEIVSELLASSRLVSTLAPDGSAEAAASGGAGAGGASASVAPTPLPSSSSSSAAAAGAAGASAAGAAPAADAAAAPAAPAPKKKAVPAAPIELTPALRERLEALVRSARVMLFMKGVPDAPECGFSSSIVKLLRAQEVPFGSFDILRDEGVRQGLKAVFNWPTFPQVYVDGKLIGGLDIVREMAEDGPLKEQFGI